MNVNQSISVFLLLAFSSTTFAAKKIVSDFPEIAKESFLPDSGNFILLGRFSIGNSNTSLIGPAGTVLDAKSETTDFSYRLAYGLADSITLDLQGKYSIKEKQENTFGPGSINNGTTESSKSSGVQEPEIKTTFRVYENQSSKVRVHIVGGYSPKIQTATYATQNSDGNAGTGGNQYNISAAIYKEVETVEITLGLTRNFIDLKKTEDPNDSQKLTENAEHQSTEITIGALKQISEKYTLGAGFGLLLTDGYQITGFTGNQVTSNLNYDSSSGTAINLVSKYQMTDSSLLIFDFINLLTYSQTATAGTTQLNIGDISSQTFRLGWMMRL